MNSCFTKITTLLSYTLLLVQKRVPEHTDSSALVFLLTLDSRYYIFLTRFVTCIATRFATTQVPIIVLTSVDSALLFAVLSFACL